MAGSRKTLTAARTAWLLPLVCLLASGLAFGQGQSADEQDPPPAKPTPTTAEEDWAGRVDRMIRSINVLSQSSSDADSLFHQLDDVLANRIQLINQHMRDARSPIDPVNTDQGLPSDIVTITDLHKNIVDLYAARVRLLPYLSNQLRLEVTATDVIGVGQLAMEFEYIWHRIRFRALSLPAASEDLLRHIQIAPLPIIWRIIQFILVVAIFQWWRNWLPETLRRMQVSLTEIRPRTSMIVRRMRLLWYVEQLRRPLEWLLVMSILLSMIEMDGLDLLVNIIESVVRWILLGWLAVTVLDAFSARGAAGLSGEDRAVRLKSLRLIAGWLVLLGLGLDLATNLAGNATLHAWVWRLFQVLALPVLLLLLHWWRQPIFTRLEREAENSETVQGILRSQNGIRSYGSAANGALWLVANGLRRSLMRIFLRVGDVQGLGLTSVATTDDPDTVLEEFAGISDSQRKVLMTGESGFDKHARTERRRLIRQAKNRQPGNVAVIGERGIGKSAFLQDVHLAMEGHSLLLECKHGTFDEIQESICEQLGIRRYSIKHVSSALQKKDIGTVLIENIHRLSRPVVDGQVELRKLTEFVEAIEHKILWIISVDFFAWQFLHRVRADQASIHEVIRLPSWTEEQLSAFLEQRNAEAEIEPDFSLVQIPSEHAVTDFDTAEERNKAGIYRMLWTVSGGNPAVALLIWSNCLYYDDEVGKQLLVRLPVQLSSRDLDTAAHNVMLVLRCIAQADLIAEEDIVDNLRLPTGAVGSAMHYCGSRGWIEEYDGRYRVSMQWFKAVTRVLARQNLLVG